MHLAIGDYVLVPDEHVHCYLRHGMITAIQNGMVTVQKGILQAVYPVAAVIKDTRPAGTQRTVFYDEPQEAPSALDIHGMRYEEAQQELEKYFDIVLLAGLKYCRIIHGKGTGTLRELVHAFCRSHPMIKSFSTAPYRTGNYGCTIVEMK